QIVEHFNQAYFILTKYNLELKNVAVYLRDKDFCRYAYDFNFEAHTNIRTDLLARLREVFNSKVPFSLEYRSTGVILSDFKEYIPKQLSLDDINNVTFEKNKKLMHAIEAVNKFYWKKAVNIWTI
ncbi:MAG: hypothetical protein ACD_3C00176G0002, partial [uncultured bacterium (gcode 4)]